MRVLQTVLGKGLSAGVSIGKGKHNSNQDNQGNTQVYTRKITISSIETRLHTKCLLLTTTTTKKQKFFMSHLTSSFHTWQWNMKSKDWVCPWKVSHQTMKRLGNYVAFWDSFMNTIYLLEYFYKVGEIVVQFTSITISKSNNLKLLSLRRKGYLNSFCIYQTCCLLCNKTCIIGNSIHHKSCTFLALYLQGVC